MRVLLTGGAGYIGSHTAVELLQAGHEVIIADNFSTSKSAVIQRIAMLGGRTPLVYQVDAADSAQLQQIFIREKPDGVIHFAGSKNVAESVRKPLQYYQNNLGTILTLLQCMQQAQVNRLIVSSSAAVYGQRTGGALSEACVGVCESPYGRSKRMLEQIVQDQAAAQADFSAVILRYFNPVGAHPSGLLGEDCQPGNLLTELARAAAGKRPALHIYGADYPTADGTGMRDFIHVVDVARGHLAALTYSAEHCGVQTVNLGTGRCYSVLEATEAFCRVNRVQVPRQIVERRPGDVAACYADVRRAQSLLHWQARYSLSDMCRDAWNWQKNNPDGYEENCNGSAVDNTGNCTY